MELDSVVAEVRQAREALAARFNYDLRAIIEDIRLRQAASGRKLVRLPPRPPRKTAITAKPSKRQPNETAAS